MRCACRACASFSLRACTYPVYPQPGLLRVASYCCCSGSLLHFFSLLLLLLLGALVVWAMWRRCSRTCFCWPRFLRRGAKRARSAHYRRNASSRNHACYNYQAIHAARFPSGDPTHALPIYVSTKCRSPRYLGYSSPFVRISRHFALWSMKFLPGPQKPDVVLAL